MISRSGPHNPGPAFFLFLLLLIVNIVWLVIDIFKSVRGKNIKPEILIHIMVLLIWMSLFVKD